MTLFLFFLAVGQALLFEKARGKAAADTDQESRLQGPDLYCSVAVERISAARV